MRTIVGETWGKTKRGRPGRKARRLFLTKLMAIVGLAIRTLPLAPIVKWAIVTLESLPSAATCRLAIGWDTWILRRTDLSGICPLLKHRWLSLISR
jgi:hypothetical protein